MYSSDTNLEGGLAVLECEDQIAGLEPQQQHRQNPNPNHGQRDFHRDRGHGRNFEHDRKRELYRVNSAAANVAQAGEQVSPRRTRLSLTN